MAEEKKKKEEKKTVENTNKKDSNPKKPKFNIYWIYGIIAVLFFAVQFFYTVDSKIEITRNRFEQEMLRNNDVEKIIIVKLDNTQFVEIYIKPDRLNSGKYDDIKGKKTKVLPVKGPHYYFNIGSLEIFEQRLEKVQENISEADKINVSYETRKNYFGDTLSWLLPILILVAIWIFIFRRMGGAGGASNIFNVGKSKATIFDKEGTSVKTDFRDVAGMEEAKIEIREIVDFLKQPKKYTELGGKIPKGALLIGPPGTGKTLLARAVAGEAHVPFFSMSGSDFVEMFVGVGASRVRDLFKQAKEKAPCIIFIDEIDAIGRARGRNPNFGGNDERENTLNQLLTEMDGFASNSGVIILAATNRADVLDPALLRAGRFDRQIHVELPDLNERKEIFEVHLRPLEKLDKKVNVDFLAKQTPGFSGADIANVCNEAALIAARKDKKIVEKQDFLDAVDRIVGGLEKKNKIISVTEKKTIAYHEAGHATVSWLLEHANPLVKVTIIPRGFSLGAAWYLPEERQITTTEQIMDEMASSLGGRVAEEMSFNKISTGALNDLEKVTKQAYAMVTYFGMSDKIGNLSFYDSSGQSEYSFNKPYSEKTAELIDKEVKSIIDIAYKRAKEVLLKNKEKHKQLAELLLEKEVIFSEDLEKIFGKRKWEKEDDLIKQKNNKKIIDKTKDKRQKKRYKS
ncbi:MAG: ATP-dependent zinc metalloprotease FtsH [Bacteroidales bacterium]|nr:ATP-dependent zinc metalloprotease FtsH [Bacteroidales bacterium]